MVMKIEKGKFYRTRDGRKATIYKIEKMLYSDEHLAYYTTEEGHDEVVYASNGRGNDINGKDHPVDLIAEWQDEPKKEISDMSEVKFKVGDRVKSVSGDVYDKNWDNVIIHQIDEDGTANCIWGRQNGVGDGGLFNKNMIELIPSIPEPNTKWVFNDGQDFVVRVVGFNEEGFIVLEVLKSAERNLNKVGSYFTFENEPEKFGEFYKPWVEKPKSVTGYARIERDLRTGEILVWAEGHATEEAACNHFDSGEGSYELLDVVKVEWEQP
jgi:hypothetical protein